MTRPRTVFNRHAHALRIAATVASELGELRLATSLFACERALRTEIIGVPLQVGCSCDDEDVRCEVHVWCDQNCQALRHPDPDNVLQLREALDHWRNHSLDFGCSHGA